MRADFRGVCQRCPNDILPGQEIYRTRGGYAHASCAPGADD